LFAVLLLRGVLVILLSSARLFEQTVAGFAVVFGGVDVHRYCMELCCRFVLLVPARLDVTHRC
jgi:hypothetical protein